MTQEIQFSLEKLKSIHGFDGTPEYVLDDSDSNHIFLSFPDFDMYLSKKNVEKRTVYEINDKIIGKRYQSENVNEVFEFYSKPYDFYTLEQYKIMIYASL